MHYRYYYDLSSVVAVVEVVVVVVEDAPLLGAAGVRLEGEEEARPGRRACVCVYVYVCIYIYIYIRFIYMFVFLLCLCSVYPNSMKPTTRIITHCETIRRIRSHTPSNVTPHMNPNCMKRNR